MVHERGKSLLQKLNLDVDELDYKFIKGCKDPKKLENILRVLRSGEEGLFPDLIRFCEDHLRSNAPNSSLLQEVKGVAAYADLPPEEAKLLLEDIKDWSRKSREQHLVVNDFSTKNLPPVRRVSTAEEKSMVEKSHATKASVPRSYAEWDRFDVNEELKKLDPDGEQPEKRTEVKRALDIEKSVPMEGYSREEQELLAEMEKLKGNEAFRSGDYSEAVLYYGRSLSLTKSPVVLNNRAQAHLKMKNYWAAVLDCNKVLSMEPDNIKALFRRGLAHAGSEEYPLAVLDLKQVLELDPDNRAAKEELLKLKKRCIPPVDKKTVSIEVLEEEESGGGDNEEVGFSLPIEDVTPGINRAIREKIRETMEDSDGEVFGELSRSARDMLSICNRKPKSGKAHVGGISKVSSRSLKPTRESSRRPSVAGIEEVKVSDVCARGVRWSDGASIGSPEESCPKQTLSNGRALQGSTSEHTTTSSSEAIHSDTTGIESRTEPSVATTIENDRSLIPHPELSHENSTARMHPAELVSPREFRRLWSSEGPRSALLSVRPNRLPGLLSSELDGTMLYETLMAAALIVREGRVSFGMEILKHLTKAERLRLAALLLSDREKRGVIAFLSRLEQEHQLDISWLRDALCIQDI